VLTERVLLAVLGLNVGKGGMCRVHNACERTTLIIPGQTIQVIWLLGIIGVRWIK